MRDTGPETGAKTGVEWSPLKATVPVVDTTGLNTDNATCITWIRARWAAGIVKPAARCAAVLSVAETVVSVRAQAVIKLAPIVTLRRR
jgi:hypothetical protein